MSSIPAQNSGFFVAPFIIDGQLHGLEFWDFDRLSTKWISICREFLKHYGAAFEAPWSGNLSHISTRFTSASGAALVTFSVAERAACSIALLSGVAPTAEGELLGMFVASLRQTPAVQNCGSAKPFEAMPSITERPLLVTVPWPDPTIAAGDADLVAELAIHLAAAFFLENL